MNRPVILILDDEMEQRAIFRTTLERDGYAVLEAGDGVAGLEAMERDGERIALVITDMVMPRIGGREFLWRMNQSYPRTPVLVTSGLLDRVTASDEGRLHVAGFLSKPVTPGTLLMKVRDLLGPGDGDGAAEDGA